MLSTFRSGAHWVGRHAFPAIIATVIAVGAAGGGIGYAVASQHTSTSPTASSPAPTGSTSAPAANGKKATAASRAAALMQRALSLLASQTGQTVAAVRAQLEAGKSIDDIAGAKAPAIENQILGQLDKLAARAVSAGKITAAQEATGLAMAKTKVEALMAEPGTQLLNDAQQFLKLLQNPGAGHHRATTSPSPSPSPAA